MLHPAQDRAGCDQRTHRTMISASKWRPLKTSARLSHHDPDGEYDPARNIYTHDRLGNERDRRWREYTRLDRVQCLRCHDARLSCGDSDSWILRFADPRACGVSVAQPTATGSPSATPSPKPSATLSPVPSPAPPLPTQDASTDTCTNTAYLDCIIAGQTLSETWKPIICQTPLYPGPVRVWKFHIRRKWSRRRTIRRVQRYEPAGGQR